MRLQSEDERIFRAATGVDLNALVERHMGKESQDQVFEWITSVLGHEYFEFTPGSFAIHTLKGWAQYVEMQQLNGRWPRIDAEIYVMSMEPIPGKTSDDPTEPQ